MPIDLDLPLPIMRAIARAALFHEGAFAHLSLQDRSMIVEVLRCVSKDSPFRQVFVRRTTIAARLGYSLATVTRLLAKLEDLGWIVRAQVKSRVKGFQVGSIALTSAAVSWLGFYAVPAKTQPPAAAPIAQRQPSVSDACRDYREEKEEHSPGGQSPLGGGFANSEPIGASADERASTHGEQPRDRPLRPIHLPKPLAWLADHINPIGVCRLMKDARGLGVRLEHVTSTCADQIRNSENGFAYVRSLLGLDRDWKFLAEQRASDQMAAVEERRVQQVKDGRIEDLQGKSFIGDDGVVRKVDGLMLSLFTPNPQGSPKNRGNMPIKDAFFAAIDSGRLRPW